MFKRFLAPITFILVAVFSLGTQNTFAESADNSYGIGMSPLSQKISLAPGETYSGSFKIHNVSTTEEFGYDVETSPYYVDENYNNVFSTSSAYTQIAEWTTLSSGGGVLAASEEKTINYSITVPQDAPAGGQYMAIMVTSNESRVNSDTTAVGISAKQAMAFLVYAEISGTTTHGGEIRGASVPGFLLSGKISGTVSVKNTGNVHGLATYKLQVFPLFSDEEVYTNEEEPQINMVLPDRTLLTTTTWEDTPSMGIFKVVYTVEFEDAKTEVERIVVVCPIWLIITIIFVLVLGIFKLATRGNKKDHKKIRR